LLVASAVQRWYLAPMANGVVLRLAECEFYLLD
jgi:hypothetical protein